MNTHTEYRAESRVIPFPRACPARSAFRAGNDDDDRPPPCPAASRLPVAWRVVEARAA